MRLLSLRHRLIYTVLRNAVLQEQRSTPRLRLVILSPMQMIGYLHKSRLERYDWLAAVRSSELTRAYRMSCLSQACLLLVLRTMPSLLRPAHLPPYNNHHRRNASYSIINHVVTQ